MAMAGPCDPGRGRFVRGSGSAGAAASRATTSAIDNTAEADLGRSGHSRGSTGPGSRRRTDGSAETSTDPDRETSSPGDGAPVSNRRTQRESEPGNDIDTNSDRRGGTRSGG